MLQICTYNTLSASTRQGCRLEEILFTLQTNHVIFLTGTKRPRAHCSLVTQCAGWIQTFRVGYVMGRGTNRHAGLTVAVKLDICETWQIREVASPQAGVQGRRGAIRVKTSKLDLMVTHCFVLRREGRRLQLIPHRRPRDHWPLMIRVNLELLYGGVTMAPRDAVTWGFDAIMPALHDTDRRIPLRKEVEKWSSTHADTILEGSARGQIEKAWTQMADALHQMYHFVRAH